MHICTQRMVEIRHTEAHTHICTQRMVENRHTEDTRIEGYKVKNLHLVVGGGLLHGNRTAVELSCRCG